MIRKVWKLIEEMKGSRAILLTTHSMEECDALADRIGIMANGSLRCIGDSLTLKRKYGVGYNLNLVIIPSKINELRQMIQKHIPDANEASNNAGSVIYTIVPEKIGELSDLLETIEDHCEETTEEKRIIRDWGISHTTLEEVYLKVTHEEFHDFDDVDDENDLLEKKDDKTFQDS
jgi:ABC-type multidrug transport system ATPase subunit